MCESSRLWGSGNMVQLGDSPVFGYTPHTLLWPFLCGFLYFRALFSASDLRGRRRGLPYTKMEVVVACFFVFRDLAQLLKQPPTRPAHFGEANKAQRLDMPVAVDWGPAGYEALLGNRRSPWLKPSPSPVLFPACHHYQTRGPVNSTTGWYQRTVLVLPQRSGLPLEPCRTC
ncbi:hypothetical protein BDV95DRAFT_312717 [Massariosphaeria phaeospora]|uniref:Uncharacterized protein n=1 Tax=Massariosphaeria phaeospora TaxID=100035 RepID=A0A7C8MFE2_9PLEO|nr:hypothetical protein BDV95DRAFT_312717 [Massariosphaeria phaeospora]